MFHRASPPLTFRPPALALKFFKVVLLGAFATSLYFQSSGNDKIYASEKEALADICPSSTVCMEFCVSCVKCTMSTATDSNPATHSWLESCGWNPRGGESCKPVEPCVH
eukprot:s1156_g4.t1